jgi:TolB-like protein
MTTAAQLRRLPRVPDTRKMPLRIAVLPFDDLTPTGQACPVADSLMALLAASLATRHGIAVVSRRTTPHYKPARTALADIARDLDVSRIVEGWVLRMGEQVHVIVRLVHAHTGLPLVARSYRGSERTMEHVQAAIAWELADDLAAAVNPPGRRKGEQAPKRVSAKGALSSV